MTRSAFLLLTAAALTLGAGQTVAFAQSKAMTSHSSPPAQSANPQTGPAYVPQQTPTFNNSTPYTVPQTPETPVPSSTPNGLLGSGK
jgi:hypothetical protein